MVLTNYDVTAIIATCALFLSLAFWVTLKKRWLPQLKTEIIEEAPAIGRKTYELIKKDLPDVKKLFKEELPEVMKALKKELKDEVPDLKIEIPKLLEEQAPKLVETFLKDITKRINDPKEEELADVMSAIAFSGMAAFRACMKDPGFNKEVTDYINGRMTGVAAQLETRLPGIFVKAAPEIKKAFLADGGGGEGGGGILSLLGIDLKSLGINLGQ